MMCNKQTMIRTGLGLGAILLVAYFALPQFRAYIVGLSPILLSLLCPISMFFMMKGMASCQKQEKGSDRKQDVGDMPDAPGKADAPMDAPGWAIRPAANRLYRLPPDTKETGPDARQ